MHKGLYIQRISYLVLALVLTLGLAACGSSNGGNGGGGDGDNVLENEQVAEVVAQSVAQSLSRSIELFVSADASGLVPFAPSGVSGQQSGSCEPAVSGSAPDTDADNDGIELDRTETYTTSNCSFSNPNGPSFAFTGEVSIADKDDNDPQSGYTVDTTDGQPLTFIQDGQEVFSIALAIDTTASGGALNASYDVTYEFSGQQGQGGGSLDYSLDVSFTPANEARTEGDVSYSGSFEFSGQGETYTLDISSSGLYYDASCQTNFDRGSVTVSDSASNTATVTYSCDSSSVSTSF